MLQEMGHVDGDGNLAAEAFSCVEIKESLISVGKTYEDFVDNGLPDCVIIPEGVKVIGMRAFQGCENVTSFILPKTLTSIEDGAFRCCGATSFTIPETVKKIGANAFEE